VPKAQQMPIKEDLRRLPLRAILAYAVRCARRIEPLKRLLPPGSASDGDDAQVATEILVAERFCVGQSPVSTASGCEDAGKASHIPQALVRRTSNVPPCGATPPSPNRIAKSTSQHPVTNNAYPFR